MSRQLESDRRQSDCAMCSNFKPIKAKGMCQNCWHKVKRRNNPEFFLRTRYTEMYQRCSNYKRVSNKHYIGLEICTREEFLTRFRSDYTFLSFFTKWVESGNDYKLCPSIDRIDVQKGYILGNMQFLTHSQNCSKDNNKMRVAAINKSGETIGVFESQGAAAFALELPQANIWKVLNGERKSAGGLRFERADYDARLFYNKLRHGFDHVQQAGPEAIHTRGTSKLA